MARRQGSFSLGGTNIIIDVATGYLVIDTEGIFEFLLHGLDVGILHQECGTKLAELPELDLSAPVLVHLLQQVSQFLLARPGRSK